MAERKCSARLGALGQELGSIGRELEVCRAAIVVAVRALQAQHADHDAEVALVIQRAVGDRLEEQIGKMSALAVQLKRTAGPIGSSKT